MKKDRQKLEDNLELIVENYSTDNRTMEKIIEQMITKGFSRGRISGFFTKVIPFIYATEIELCLFTKYLYDCTHELKIKPEEWFTDIELSVAVSYQKIEEEKVKYILLHNVDQITETQFLCSKESYQNISVYMGNGLFYYNPNTQRQLIRKKSGGKIVEVINIDPKKVSEITESMLDNSFCPNAIVLNIRKINNQEEFKYDSKNRTLLIKPDNVLTFVDMVDGAHRICGMVKTVESKPDIDRITSIFIHPVTEERANQIIRQESLSTPVSQEWVEFHNTSNINMEVAKNINLRQRKNEMYNRIGLNEELRTENKLVTFETLSKTIEFMYDLENEPVIKSSIIEEFLIDIFNICVGVNYEYFNENLKEGKEISYVATNNMFICYIIIGELIKQKYNNNWEQMLIKILKSLDFNKNNSVWKTIGIENNVNKRTFNKMFEYFKNLISKMED
jgi:hypothetical protein